MHFGKRSTIYQKLNLYPAGIRLNCYINRGTMKTLISAAAVFAISLCMNSSRTHAAEAQSASVQAAIAEFNALHHAKAKQLFSDLLKDDQNKNVANYYLGRIALGSGDYTAASKYLETSVRTSPNSADELYWLATSCVLLFQRPSESTNIGLVLCYQQNLEMALSIDSTHLPTLAALYQFNATWPVMAGASSERAAELLKQIAAISKPDADVARLIELNHKEEAGKALALSQSMVAAYPDHEKALLEAGKTFANNKRYAEAQGAFGKITANNITIDNRIHIQTAYLEIGQIAWLTKSNIDQGIAALTKVVDTNTFAVNFNTNWAYFRLAQLSQLKGDATQQKKYLQLLDSTGIEKGAALVKAMEN